MKRLLNLALALTVITLLLGGALRPSAAGRPPQAAVGYPAPEFTLADLQGQRVHLADLRGKRVLLNFWATWCPPCRAEMPELKRLQAERPDVMILGVDLGERAETVAAWMAAGGYHWPVVLDDGAVSETYEAFSVPTSYFIDPAGVIRASYRGPMSLGLMQELLESTGGGQRAGGVSWPAWLAGRLLPPVLPVGPLPLQTGPLLWVLAAVVADWIVRRRSGAPEVAERLLGWLLGGAVLGAKLGEVLRSPGSFLAFPRLLIALPAGRWALVGALLGAGVGLWWVLRRVARAERWPRLNELGLPLLVGLGVAGLGSGEAALLRAGGWLLGAILLWWWAASRQSLRDARAATASPQPSAAAELSAALAWAAAIWVVTDLARPVATLPGGLTVEQLLGALVVGGSLLLAHRSGPGGADWAE